MFNPMMTIDNTAKQLLKDPKKRHAWIIYQVKLQGSSLAKIADDAGVSRQCLYQVFHRTYPRMEKVIADALKLPPKELWPERYDDYGLPIYRMGRPVGSGKKSIAKNIENTTQANMRNVHEEHSDRQCKERRVIKRRSV